MSLGFALVHPQRLSTALDESFPQKVGWDDGADIALAAVGLDLGDDPMGGFLSQLQVEALDLLGHLQGLVLPGGPFAAIVDALTGEGDGVATWLRRIGDFLAGLDPLRLKATLSVHVDALFGHFPGFDLRTLDDRLRRLAQRALDVLRAPLLGGRDDGAAHRAYRAASLLLARLEPLLAALDGAVGAFDVAGSIKAALRAAIDGIPPALLQGLARIGRVLRDDIGAFVEAATSLSVSVSVGPSGLVSGTPTHRDDGDPQPFAKGHWLWVMDLVTSGTALFWSIWGFQRARGIKRATEWIEFLLATCWRVFRDAIRLFVQPAWLSKDSSFFVRMLFGEWGDLFVRLVLMLLGSIEDMVAWSNFVMGLGNRFMKWFALELQPRLVYQFCRSVWYLRSWHDDTSTSTRGDPRFTRVLWAGWAPMLLVIAIMGFCLPGESYDLQSFFQRNHDWATAGFFLTIGLQIVGMLLVPWILMGTIHARYAHDSFDFIALAVAAFAVVFIGVEALASTNAGAETGKPLQVYLYTFFVLSLAVAAIGGARIDGPPDSTVAKFRVFFGWFVTVFGSIGIGLVTMIVWWFIRRDGEDPNNDFAGLDVSTSPYRLPYPRGDMWFCGQGFHGIFSHTWRSAYDPPFNAKAREFANDNLFGYDFNNARHKPACAARQGFVQRVEVDKVDDGPKPNRILVQHWDWVAGHDAGTDQERELTMALYLHLAQNRARCAVGQLVAQGYNVAGIDDTGTSALHHLHFHVFTTQAQMRPPSPGATPTAQNRDVTMPTLFGDSDVRGFRSFGHVDGKPISLAYYTSENVGEENDAVTTTPITQPLTLTALPVPQPSTPGHTHTLTIGPDRLGTAGLPATLTLMTSINAGHAHAVTLTAAQVQALLAHGGGIETADATGPVVDLAGSLPTVPPAVVHRHTLQIVDGTAATRTLQLVSPPGARLVSDVTSAPDLVGAHVAVDVDGQAANHWLLGVHRPAIVGTVALDRGPTGGAKISIGSGGPSPTTGAGLSSARLAAELWTAAWGDPAMVRPEPVVVLESRARGLSAQVQVAGPALSVWGLSGTQAGSGTGAVGDLGAASVASLVPLVQAALGAGPGALPLTTSASTPLGIQVAGAPVASFAGSSGRIAAVMSAAYDPATGALRSDGALPLVAGRLVLDGHVVPLLAAPARLHLDAAMARLESSTLRGEPLVLTVMGAVHTVVFRAADVGADDAATLDLAATRVAAEADGVRAWRKDNALVIETVAAGAGVTLQASKGAFSSPAATGAAPVTGGQTVQDTTAMTSSELRAAIDDAASRAGRAAAPVLTVVADGVGIVVTFEVNAKNPTLGASFGWAAAVLTPAPDPASSAVLRLTPPAGMPGPMWADITVHGSTWQIAVDADVARVDLPLLVRAVGTGETLSITTASGTQSVTLPTGASLVDQVRAFAAVPGLTARVAWRWRIESARFQRGDLTLSGGTPSALPGMGLLGPTPATQRSAGPSNEVVQADAAGRMDSPTSLLGVVGGSPEDDTPAFSASVAADSVTIAAPAGMTLDVTLEAPASPSDPTGLVGAGPSRTSVALTPGLLQFQALVWQVRTLRDGHTTMAETRVQLAAAPAKARADKAAGWPWTDTSGTIIQQEIAAERGPLTLTITIPGSPDVDVTMTVDLTGAATIDEVVARLRREAALVEAWRVDGRLHLQTRGAGSGWRLRLQGASTLASLGFDPARFAPDGTLSVQGGGQVRDLAAATATELAAAFTAGAEAAAWPRARHFTVQDTGSAIQLRTLGAPITVTAEPQRLLDALAPAPVPGGVDIAMPGTLSLDQGWIRVMQGGELRHVVSVVGSRAAVQAAQPLPTAAADVTNLLTTIAGKSLDVTIDGAAAPTWVVPATLGSIHALVAAMIRHFVAAHVRVVALSDGPHLRISSRRRGSTSSIQVSAGNAAPLLGFSADLDSNGGGQDPGVGTFEDLAAVLRDHLAKALEERPLEAGQGVLAATAGTTAVTLRPTAGQVEWTSVPSYVTGSGSDPGGSLIWLDRSKTLFRGLWLAQAWSVPGPLVAQPLEFRVTDPFPASGSSVFDRKLISALWANPARLGPWVLPADLGTLDGRTLRLVLDGANVDITFSGLAGLASAYRPAAIVAAIEGATGGRVRAWADATLRIESTDEGSAAAVALDAAPANDARSLLGNPAPVGATGSGNVGRLSAVSGDEIAAAVRASFVIDSDLQQDAQWTDYNPDRLGNRLVLSSQKAGTASAVIPVILPAALRMRRSLQRGPARGGAVVLPALTGNVTLDGSLYITLNGGNTGARAVPATTVEVRFAAGTYSPRRVWLRIHEELHGRGVGAAGIYPDGTGGFRIAIETRLPGLQGTVQVPAAAPDSTADVVSKLGALDQGKPRFGRGWPGLNSASLAVATLGLRTTNSGTALVVGRTWRFTPGSGGTTVPFELRGGDTVLSQLAARLDALLAAPGTDIGVARLHETDGCVYVELIDTSTTVAVFDPPGPPVMAPPTAGIFGQPAIPPGRIGAMGDMWVDEGMQLRVTNLVRTCRLIAFVPDGTTAGRALDTGWVRMTPDVTGAPQTTPNLNTRRYGVLVRAEAARSDGYRDAGEMLISTGTATLDGAAVPIVHQARYWFMVDSNDAGLGPVTLPDGTVVIEVSQP